MIGAEQHPSRLAGARGATANDWCRVVAVDSFLQCSADDLFRVYPRLMPRNGVVPDALKSHLSRCVAIRALPSVASRGRRSVRRFDQPANSGVDG